MKHILTNREGLKVAVIVNDMAECLNFFIAILLIFFHTFIVNIDANLILMEKDVKLKQTQEKLVQMQNGCICCTLREDLVLELKNLADENRFDYCIIESTGISEPIQVAETFTFKIPEEDEEDEEEEHSHQHSSKHDMASQIALSEIARLDTTVTVVDAFNFHRDLQSVQTLKQRYGDKEVSEEDERNIANLLIDQIEFADVILINKIDLVSEQQLKEVDGVVRSLNPNAKVYHTTNSKIDLKNVLNTNLFNFSKAQSSPGWLLSIKGEMVPETEEFGVTNYIYRRRKPFDPSKLYNFITKDEYLTKKSGVVRSKGFVWLASRNNYCGDWEQAGMHAVVKDGGVFFCCLAKETWDEMPDSTKADIMKDFQEPYGDRRQELVLIGFKDIMNKDALFSILDSLLISDEDFAKGPEYWMEKFAKDDPFPPWTSFEDDDEDEWEDIDEDDEEYEEEDDDLEEVDDE